MKPKEEDESTVRLPQGWHSEEEAGAQEGEEGAGMSARVLVADPPWTFGDALGKRGAAANYSLLSLRDILRFELPPLADDAYLFLWRVSALGEEAYRVARAWGFTPKAEIVWMKQTATGKRWFGMGHHVRNEHETCLVATRGKPQPKVRNVCSTFMAPVGRHSEKPDAFYALVEEFAHGPYVELFARRRRAGWTCLGNDPALVAA